MESPLPRRLFTKAYASPARFLKAVGRGDRTHSPEAILVYPERDYQGDIVHPEGGNWSAFHRNPVVNFNHGPYIGTGELVMRSIAAPDPAEAGMTPVPPPENGRINAPFGTTKLFTCAADFRGLQLPKYSANGNVLGQYTPNECLELAEEVAPLILCGAINGVSIEFMPIPGGLYQKSLGRSPGLRRDAFEFERWNAISWANCPTPINAKARQVLPDDAECERLEKCIRFLERPVGSLFVRKSMTRYVDSALYPDRGRTTVAVRVHKKAAPPFPPKKGDEEDDADADADTDDTPAVAPEPQAAAPAPKPAVPAADDDPDGYFGSDDADPEAEPVPSGVKTLLTLAQAAMDACQAANDGAALSDNPKLKAFIAREIGWFSKKAAKLQSYANMLGERLKSGGEDDIPEPDDDADDAPAAPETDDGAVIAKSFPHYRPKQLRQSDLGPPVVRKAKPADDLESHRLDALEKSIWDILKALKR